MPSCRHLKATIRPSCGYDAATIRPPQGHYAATIRPQCGHHKAKIRPPLRHHSEMKRPPASIKPPAMHHAANMWPPCHHHMATGRHAAAPDSKSMLPAVDGLEHSQKSCLWSSRHFLTPKTLSCHDIIGSTKVSTVTGLKGKCHKIVDTFFCSLKTFYLGPLRTYHLREDIDYKVQICCVHIVKDYSTRALQF